MRLSDPAGAECGTAGLASSESGIGIGDLVIDGALALVAGFAGSAICPLPDHPTTGDATAYATCTSLFSGLGPTLLARKTVRYRCTRQGIRSDRPTAADGTIARLRQPLIPTENPVGLARPAGLTQR